MSLLDKAVSLALPAVPKPIVGFFSKRYIAGSSRDDAFRVVRELERDGAMATLDILGEFISSLDQAERNTKAYVDLIRQLAVERFADANVSVKLTALGLLLDAKRCLDNVRALCRAAAETGGFVRIDMEDARCTDATLAIYRSLRSEFPGRVGVVLQARLRRTIDDIDAVTAEPSNFRLCKGIYLEPRSIAYTDPDIIRSNFTLALERMFARKAYVGIATHDERLVFDALRLVRQLGLTPAQYEFQMLLGVEEELRGILLRSGHRLRVYVPYGEEWYAYSVRRLRESPQLAGHALRALLHRRPARTP
jgi:proline dehydrogenase